MRKKLKKLTGNNAYSQDVAIIGMSCRFPGAKNISKFWQNLKAGADAVTEIPESRWGNYNWYHHDPDHPGTSYSKWAGFVHDSDMFDPLFFGISPREAEIMDPQQRLFLEESWKAFEDAGYAAQRLEQTRTGVFVGVAAGDYDQLLQQHGMNNVGEAFMGTSQAVLAGRTSFLLNLTGPALAIDTACSSSLVAIDRACKSLISKECDIALVGGVYLKTTPQIQIWAAKVGMLSPTGRCKTFDTSADGIAVGEGVGAVIVKRLADAERADDRIYAVIKGSGINQDGKTKGITVPSLCAQADLEQEIYRKYNINPATITYVEAHGTGTKKGDPIELNALAESFGKYTDKKQYCAIGSVKTNIGHTAFAGGVAGLIKAVLMTKHKQYVPSLHFNRPNDLFNFEASPFYVNTKHQDWKTSPGIPRRAAISSFGFSGTNAHVVIEEYIPKEKSSYTGRGSAIILLSARNEMRLRDQVQNLKTYLEEHQEQNLYDIAYTLQTGREAMEERLAIIAHNIDELTDRLNNYLGKKTENILIGNVKKDRLDFLLEGGAGKAYINYALENKESASLARLWVSGVAIDWNLLYPDQKPNKISLPAYPFARERYWVPETPSEKKHTPAGETQKQIVSRQCTTFTTAWNILALSPENDISGKTVILSNTPDSMLVKSLEKSLGTVQAITSEELSTATVSKDVCGFIDLTPLEEKKAKEHYRWIALLRKLIGKSQASRLKLIIVSAADELKGSERFGLYHMLGAEYAKVESLHLEPEKNLQAEALCELIAEAYKSTVKHTRLRHRKGKWEYPELRHIVIDPVMPPAITGPVLITGGTRGIGMTCARHLVKAHGVKKLILMGKIPLPGRETWEAEKTANTSLGKKIRDILDLERQGAEVQLLNTPLSDEKALKTSLEAICSEWGAVQGFLHCAGYADMTATAFVRKAPAAIAALQIPKVEGLMNLHQILKDHQLKFAVLCSSVSALIPRLGVGQSDYAMANSYMDSFSAYQRTQGYPYISMQWPSWKESGMGEVKGGVYQDLGLLSVTDKEGLKILDTILSAKELPPVLFPAVYDTNSFNTTNILAIPGTEEKEIVVKAATQSDVSQWLKEQIGLELKIPVNALKINTPLQDYGVDSIVLVQLIKRIEKALGGVSISPNIILEHPTIGMLADHFKVHYKKAFSKLFGQDIVPIVPEAPAPLPENAIPERRTFRSKSKSHDQAPIAVIGMACHFPDAENIARFWENLETGKDSIREIPSSRWDINTHYSATMSKAKSISKWGAFLPHIEDFDPDYFGINPELASQIDPLERQWLEVSAEAIADAGYTKETLWSRRVGVYAGSRTSNFSGKIADAHKDIIVGTGQNFITAHLAHIYNLKGPNMVVDTACSSSLTAVHLAVKSLRSGETELALAGGVDILLDETPFLLLSTAEVLSPDGRSKTFDEHANGTGLGEGCGALVLKRLDDAIASRDQIYGIIEGSAVNNDGNTMGITTPNPQTQQSLIEDAIADACIDGATISYIETHGTGTLIGDPIELKGITRALEAYTHEKAFCGVGSVKTNIGHLLSAAGIAGVIKTLLSVTVGKLPPTLHCNKPNPRFDFDNSPVYPVMELQNWNGIAGIRRAGVSAFGLGGSNAHVIISNAGIPQANRVTLPLRPPVIPYRRQRYWPDNASSGVPEEKDVNQEAFKAFLEAKTSRRMEDWTVQLGFLHNNYILRDHSVHKVRIVPGVTYLDMILRYAKVIFEQIFSISKVVFTEPLATSEDYDRCLTLHYQKTAEASYQVTVHSQRMDHKGNAYGNPSEHIHCFLKPLEQSGETLFDIAGFISRSTTQSEASEIYKKASAVEIRHGEFMQTLGKIYQNEAESLMELHLSPLAESYRKRFVAHPAFLDGSTFAGTPFSFKGDQGISSVAVTYIPFSVDTFECYRPFPSRIYVHSKNPELSSKEQLPEVIKNDIDIYNEEGELLARFNGLTTKRIRRPELIKQLIEDPVQGAEKLQTIKKEQPLVHADTTLQATPTASADQVGALISAYLRDIISKKLQRQITPLEDATGFYELGLDSKQTLELVGTLEAKCGHDFYPTLLFEYQTVEELSAYLAEYEKAHFSATEKKVKTEETSRGNQVVTITTQENEPFRQPESSSSQASFHGKHSDESIAVIGLSGRYPGANDIHEFWSNLKQGKNNITEIPGERWNAADYFDKEKGRAGKSYSKWGGFIKDADKFDSLFFNISPREAENMDPQIRLFLQESWKTIEDAGYSPKSLSEQEKTGVFAGVFWTDYQLYRASSSLNQPSSFVSAVANTVSYQMGFQGPSIGIDTQCSSSLTAIHLACESIKTGESTVALAGGVNLSLHPSKYTWLSDSMFLSSRGKCESFGEQGDGYVPGEGVGVVLLKPLSKARIDGDHIYGIIRGTAINHGGKSSGFTVPNPKAQAAVIKQAIEKAGVHPGDISYIEAHGTGTRLGDPIEITGLTKAFQTDKKQYCSIGSVKSNIGHGESAAGIAGLTKVLLQMKYQQLVPSLHSEALNPNIDFKNSPFKVQQQTEAWKTENEKPRIAGISSFGAGGSNAHIVLEEYHDKSGIRSSAFTIKNMPPIILLSAKGEARLKEQAYHLKTWLEKNEDTDLYEVAYTLQTGREAMEDRLAVIAYDTNDLIRQLNHYHYPEGNAGNYPKLLKGNIRKDKADFMLTGEAGRAYLQKAIEAREAESLAQLWVRGIHIDWSLIYPDQKPKKISLPTYPFSKVRYWIAEEEQTQSLTRRGTELHPLLHINESDLTRQKFTSVYTGEESFLADHRINDTKVFPGVGYLELAREAGRRSLHQKITQIKDITWPSPFKISNGAQKMHIDLYPEVEEISWEVYSEKETGHIHSRGKISTVAQPAPESYALATIRKRLPYSKEKEACYAIFKESGFHYGPSFRGIELLYYSREEALSRIALPKEAGYALQPGILDSALQTCVGMSFGAEGLRPALPFSAKQVNIYKELPTALWCYARKNENQKTNPGGISNYDIDLLDDEGNVLLNVKDFAALPLDRGKTSFAEKEDIGLYLYTTAWKQTNPKLAPATAANPLIVLAGGLPVLADRLKETLKVEVISVVENTTEAYFVDIFKKVKKKLQEKTPAQIMVVCSNADYPDYGFVSGLLKTAQLENPKLNGKIIVVEDASFHVLDELIYILQKEQHNFDTEVRYKEGIRTVKTVELLVEDRELKGEDIQPPGIKEGGVYLITGGAGGLGRSFARHISTTPDTHTILAGRSALHNEKQAQLNALPGISYHQCDVSDKDAVENLIKTIKDRYGKLDGIIHSAGVIRDSFLINKTEEDIREAFAPKIGGLKNLDEATREDNLDFMVLCSSVAGLMGNIGQGDYASANAWLDNYARYRNKLREKGLRKGHTLSINWPLWQDGGMQIDAGSKNRLEKQWGVLPLPTEKGIEAFERLLGSGLSQGIVFYGKNSAIKKLFFNPETSFKEEASGKTASVLPETTPQELKQAAASYLKELLSGILKLPANQFDPEKSFDEYGMDSILAVKITDRLDASFKGLPRTLLFEYHNITELADYFLEVHTSELQELITTKALGSVAVAPEIRERSEHRVGKQRFINPHSFSEEQPAEQSIAIIGMEGVFPGAKDADALWEKILLKDYPDVTGQNGNSLPFGRVDEDDLRKNRVVLGLSEEDISSLSRQQQLIYSVIARAMLRYGITKESLTTGRTGVYIGAQQVFPEEGQGQELDFENYAAYLIPNKLSFQLNLKGPSEVVNTYCTSVYVAMHRAIQSIRSGECDQAVVGGINVISDRELHLTFNNGIGQLLSREGMTRSFCDDATGFVRSEGAGVLILKPLDRAEKEGNNILAVVKSSAVYHPGKGFALETPSAKGIKQVIKTSIEKSGVPAETIDYVEAHGIANRMADAIELGAISDAYKALSAKPDKKWHISSVKPTVGHPEVASGMASIIKVIKAFEHKTIPGIVGLGKINTELDPGHSMILKPEAHFWKNRQYPKRAALNSYAVGGVNAHIILEEYKGFKEDSDDERSIVQSHTVGESEKDPGQSLNEQPVQESTPVMDAIPVSPVLAGGGESNDPDVLIIGAGIAGLISGCYLAKQGKKVRILEAHNLPGGYLQTYRRNGYRVEAVAAVIPDPFHTRILREVFKDLHIEMEWIPAPMTETLIKNSGETITIGIEDPNSPGFDPKEALIKMYCKILPDYEQQIAGCFTEMFDEDGFNKRMKYYEALTFGEFLTGHLPKEIHHHFYIPFVNPVEKTEDTSYLAFRTVFRTFVATLQHYPKGGWSALMKALVHKIKSCEGDVQYNQRVTGFDSTGDKITSVRIGEKKLSAKSIVLCGSPYPLLEKVYDHKGIKVKNEYLSDLSERKPCMPGIVLTVFFEGKVIEQLSDRERQQLHGMVVFEKGEDTVFKDSFDTNFLYVICPTFIEPSLGRKGDYFVMTANVKYISPEFWHTHKQEAREHFMKLFYRAFPTLKDKRCKSEMATPLTMEKFTLNYKGAISGWAMTPDQAGEHTLSHKTPWRNLFLAGHWVFPGPRIPWTMQSARSVAFEVAKYLKKVPVEAAPDVPKESLYGWASGVQQDAIAEIVEGILKTPAEKIKAKTSFHDYDFDSIDIMRIVRSFNEEFDINLKMGQVLGADNFGDFFNILENVLLEKQQQDKRDNHQELPVLLAECYPLSEGQKGLWFIQQLQPESTAYNMPVALALHKEADKDCLREALKLMLTEYPILRAGFMRDATTGEPFQIIRTVEESLFTDNGFIDEKTTVTEAFRKLLRRPFNLERDCLLRLHIRTDKTGNKTWLLFVIHHTVFDGISNVLFVQSFFDKYQNLLKGENLQPKQPDVACFDFVGWEQEYINSEEGAQSLMYWKNKLGSHVSIPALPGDGLPSGSTATRTMGCRTLKLDKTTLERLKTIARELNMNLSVFLLSIFKVLLYRLSGEEDISVITPVAGRPKKKYECSIGYYINMMVVRSKVLSEKWFKTFATDIKQELISSIDHAGYPFPKLASALGLDKEGRGRSPFSIAYAYQNIFDQQHEIEAADILDEVFQEVENDYFLEIYDLRESLKLHLKYDEGLFRESTVRRHLEYFENLLSGILADPQRKIGDYDMISTAEKEELMLFSKGPEVTYPDGQTVLDLFKAQVLKTPDAAALLFEEKTLSYNELDQVSDQLAYTLLTKTKAGKDKTVALVLSRSERILIAILAVLKSGSAYVPVDPEYPKARKAYMLHDSAPVCMIGEKGTDEELSESLAVLLFLDNPEELIFRINGKNEIIDISGVKVSDTDLPLPQDISPDDLAYVIYTSGSTGKPKGVMIEHGGLLNRIDWMWKHYGFESSDVIFQKTTYTFDVSVWELLMPIAYGSRGVACRKEVIYDPEALADHIQKYGITTLHFVPSMYNAFLNVTENNEKLQSVRRVITSGEALDKETVKKHYRLFGDLAPLHNLYGPTEASVDVSYYETNPEDEIIPIGRPISNMELYVLNNEQELQPVGVSGELCIGGTGLARGYLNNPPLSGEKFASHPFKPGERLYKTGDMACWLPDGNMAFMGRKDDQLKVRGYRIEPGEISSKLNEFRGVEDSVVTGKEVGGITELTACIIPDAFNAPVARNLLEMNKSEQELFKLPNAMPVFYLNRSETRFMYREIFEHYVYLKHGITIHEGDVVFDLGANIGIFSLFAHQLAKDVSIFAFEPIPPIFEQLKNNLELYNTNARVLEYGISNKEGEATFLYYPHAAVLSGAFTDTEEVNKTVTSYVRDQFSEERSHGEISDGNIAELLSLRLTTREYTCRLKTLSQVIRENNIENIDVLKIDVEKSEMAVLKGIADEDWAKIRQIVIEVHDIDGALQEIKSLLEYRGYDIAIDSEAQLGGEANMYIVYAMLPEYKREAMTHGEAERLLNNNGISRCTPSEFIKRLRNGLSEQLPDYMVPSRMALMSAFPLTPNGKLDKKALAALPDAGVHSDAQAAAKSKTEQALVEIWKEVLQRSEVGVTANFFDLGGHSLSMISLQNRINAHFQMDMKTAELFQHPKIRSLAGFIDEKRSKSPVLKHENTMRDVLEARRKRRKSLRKNEDK